MNCHQYCHSRFVLLFFAICSIQVHTLRAQVAKPTNQVPTIRSEVRVVLVDVVVTQGSGEPVAGLHRDDLLVSEGGRQQTISSFQEHTGGTVSPVALPPMPQGVYTNYPTIRTTDSINVLLLDSLNTQAVDQAYVHPQMAKYFQAAMAAPPGARTAIFTLGSKLRMVRGFTPDPAALATALTDSKSGAEVKFEPQIASPSRKNRELLACSGIKAPAGIAACKDFFAEEDAARSADRVLMTLQAFQALARYLAMFPGRKNVMWVSGSFPITFFPETTPRGGYRGEYGSELKQTTRLLTADQVAVYPISATGLTGEEATRPDNYGRPTSEENSDLVFNQIAMEALANETGGKPFYNTNGLSDAMKEAINVGSHYYTLTYTPTNTKTDGKFRRIEVKGINRSFKLAYRRGYDAASHETEETSKVKGATDPLLALMTFGMPDFAEILYKVRVGSIKGNDDASPTKSLVRYGVDFAISPQDVKLETDASGVRSETIEVALIAYNSDGTVQNMVAKKIPIHLQPDVFDSLQCVGFQLHEEIDLPQGDVFLETGISDLTANHAGTLAIPLHIATQAAQ